MKAHDGASRGWAIGPSPPFFPRGCTGSLALRLLGRFPRRGPRLTGRPTPWTQPFLPPLQPTDEVLQRASLVVDGAVPVFGHPVPSRPTPQWHRDPVTGFSWPSDRPVPLFPILGPPGALRRVWELNRMQWLYDLGVAFRKERARDLVDVGWNHIRSWIHENPPGAGINWTSSLELALRVLAWLSFVELCGEDPPSDLAPSFWSAVAAQASHIAWHLSVSPTPHNHLIGEALALVAVGVLCPWVEGASRWVMLGRKALILALEGAFRQDGSWAEESSRYASFDLDAYTLADQLLGRVGLPLPARVVARLDRARAVLAGVSWPGLPPMGDSDDVAVIPPAPLWSLRHGVSPVPPAREGVCESLAWARRDPFHVVVALGRLGLPPSHGHGHAHALGVQVWYSGLPVLVDPGTYSYAEPPWRDYFRSTAAHCTVEVEGTSQATPRDEFRWSDPYTTTVESLSAGSSFAVTAWHDGYRRLPQRVDHRRRVQVQAGRVEVEDSVSGARPFSARLHWHVHPEWEVTCVSPGEVLLSRGPIGLILRIYGPGRPVRLQGSRQPLAGWYSPSFHHLQACCTLRVEARGHLVTWFTSLEPRG